MPTNIIMRMRGTAFLFVFLQDKRKKNKPDRVNHLKNSIFVAKGTKESGKLKAEGSKFKAERSSKVFGEIILIVPERRGSIWKRMRRRKRETRTMGNAE
jgi:hypothetical protein